MQDKFGLPQGSYLHQMASWSTEKSMSLKAQKPARAGNVERPQSPHAAVGLDSCVLFNGAIMRHRPATAAAAVATQFLRFGLVFVTTAPVYIGAELELATCCSLPARCEGEAYSHVKRPDEVV